MINLSMECSSIVCIADFGPGDLGSNLGWSIVKFKSKIEFSRIIQARTVTLQWGGGILVGIKSELSRHVL